MTARIESLIRAIPDFPKPGILFRDITPLLEDPSGFRHAVDLLADRYRDHNLSKIVGIESRGFIFGAPLAYVLGCGLSIVRKAGKLPYRTFRHTYDLEYGSDTVEIHVDTVEKGERVLLIDDLLATGGTARASTELLQEAGADVVEAAFVIELADLGGRSKIPVPVHTLVSYG